MSITSPFAPAQIAGRRPSLWDPAVAVLLGCALVLAMTAAKAVAVWKTGIFFDPDDAMRAVEVRDLLAGQGWFDLVQHRMAPGHGVPMHWSRLADLPVAGLVLPLRGALGADAAERVARLSEPALLLVGFMLCMARLGRTLLGARGPLAACLLAAGGLETAGTFIPGHIHHHGLQETLLLALAALAVDGIGDAVARPRRFAVMGGVVALTLAINLQNLPFVAAAVASLGIGWVRRGEPFAAALCAFATVLMAATGAVFLIQIPPDRYMAATCDAFGVPHLAAAWLGGAGLLVLSAFSPRLHGPAPRAILLAGTGLAVMLAVGHLYPGCLGDPFSGVDPLLRARWLADVGEIMPLVESVRRDPAGDLPIAMALAIGLALNGAATLSASGPVRARWALVAGFALVGSIGSLWAVRVAASAEPFTALGVGWALLRLFDPARPRKPLAAPLCTVCALAMTQAGWAAALPPAVAALRSPSPSGPRVDATACFAPSSYEALAALPAGSVMSTIDPGSQILAYTHHSVLAAPYHRNGYGDLAALRFFDADAGDARAVAAEVGARYVAVCLTSPEIVEDAARAPDGVAAAVLRGDVPRWLRPVGGEAGPVRVFEVDR